MELRHLRYFVTVAEELNFSRAAARLRVAQPAISRQIRDLENELGAKLFERTARTVKLTEAGRVLLVEARAVLRRVDDALHAVRAVGDGGELRVGYAPSLTVKLLPAALRRFQEQHPGNRVALHDLSTEEMLAGLRDGKLDMALMVQPTPAMLRGLRFEPLTRDEYRVAVAPNHPLAKKRRVTIPEIAREPLIAYSRRDYPEYIAGLAGLWGKLRIAQEHDGVSSLIAAVEAGHGVAIVAKSIACLAGLRLKLVVLSPAPAPLVIGAVLRRDKPNGLAARFLKCFQS